MEKLNPFVKCVTLLCCGLILSFSYSVLLNGCILAACLVSLLFFSKAKLSSVIKILIPALLAAVSIFFTGLLFTNDSTLGAETVSKVNSLNFEIMSYSMASVYNAIQLSTRILAFAGMGILFALTTDGEKFVMSLVHQCKLSPQYAYGVLAAIHLLPALKEELGQVRLAYQVRGMNTPAFSGKTIFLMLVNTIHWSENVAMAMESKGFDGDGERSYYQTTQVKRADWCFLLFTVLFLITGKLTFWI